MSVTRPHTILVASLTLLVACEPAADPAPDAAATSSEPAVVALPLAEPPFDREALLLAIARAASDFAVGRNDADEQRQLDGRKFELKLRFGCPGQVADARTWSFDEQERVLRIRVEPDIAIDSPLVQSLGLDSFEAVEGFWVDRPWLYEPACPVAPAAPPVEADAPPSPSEVAAPSALAPSQQGPRIGIAQFYTDEHARTGRRQGRPYETTSKLADEELPSSSGYDLVLSGRLVPLPEGRVIRCTGAPDTRPSCIVSVSFDRVAVTRPYGAIVAEWTSS